jgi:hypothetical protein
MGYLEFTLDLGGDAKIYGGKTSWEVTLGDFEFADEAVCMVYDGSVHSHGISSCVATNSLVTIWSAVDDEDDFTVRVMNAGTWTFSEDEIEIK